MTKEEIKSLYRQINGLSNEEIEAIVKAELKEDLPSTNLSVLTQLSSETVPESTSAYGSMIIGAVISSPLLGVENACKKVWGQNISRIQSIIRNNPKSSKAIMDIVCLLAPTIAQQYTGFSGMAIVGTLTIMCKHNLGL